VLQTRFNKGTVENVRRRRKGPSREQCGWKTGKQTLADCRLMNERRCRRLKGKGKEEEKASKEEADK
jgi:hypothetical protein